MGPGISRLAHRVLGDVDVHPRREVRHPYRRRGQRVSSSRGRDRVAAWSSRPDADEAPAWGQWASRFRAAIADDLDLPGAMALVAELVHSSSAARTKADLLESWDRVLGLDLHRTAAEQELPPGAAELLAEREKARAARDFETSDHLRERLAAMGVNVAD